MTKKMLFIAVGAAVTLGVAGFGAFKVYENKATGGVGFVEASDIQISDTADVRTKKEMFFDTMRPIVAAENERILELRSEIKAARKAGDTPDWLPEVADRYGVDWTGSEWDALLKRVDAVPVPLALAQSANESAWGQSRFAQKGNNMFGQWCFSEGCGLVPQRRSEGKNHEVAAYSNINASVRSYIRNINTSRAYKELRDMRWTARQNGEQPKAMALAAGLSRYSERGQAYVEEIRAMIRVNRNLMVGDAGTAASS